MTAYEIDPLADPRWERLSLDHARASVFHSPGWLRALRDAYGYQPIAFTTSPPGGDLSDGVVFCRVKSWLTGDRLVSLPFSDHCEPLVDHPAALACILSRLTDSAGGGAGRIEIRPMTAGLAASAGFSRLAEFQLHRLDLRPSPAALFGRFHKNTRRNIQRGEAGFLRYEKGASETLLEHFRHLLTRTRKRHRVPPQPLQWFRSLCECMAGRAAIHMAYRESIPVAGIFTLRHNGVMVYKYGCFDPTYRQHGGMAFLLWRTMQEARQGGVREFDFGRSDSGDAGLITFKQRWGSVVSPLTYWSCGMRRFEGSALQWTGRRLREILPYLPDRLLTATGNLLYKHVG